MNKKIDRRTSGLDGKVAIITGSNRGIGKAIALELGRQGVAIVLNGRNSRRLRLIQREMATKGFIAESFRADVRNPRECRELIEFAVKSFGRIDFVINNAAAFSRGSVEKMAPSNFSCLMETNYCAPAYLCKYAIPHLRKTEGTLIFVNSVSGFYGFPYNVAYAASKMAQAALAQALEIELFDDKIHVGILYVGYTENEEEKTILDEDGSLVYLPQRSNVKLASRESVAKVVSNMILRRKRKKTLSFLGHFAEISSRYFPRFARRFLIWKRDAIRQHYTLTGGSRVTSLRSSKVPGSLV